MATHFKRLVRNRNSRAGTSPKIIVLHTTEGDNIHGIGDLTGLANWFDNPGANASSHQGVDAEGNSVQMVPGNENAWTQASYNHVGLSIEQVGHASSSRSWWLANYIPGLLRTAQIVAAWSNQFGIPIQRAIVARGTVLRKGICEHSQLGSAGGGHHDCGAGYPSKLVLWMAKYYFYKDWHKNIGKRQDYWRLCDRYIRQHGGKGMPR